MELSVIIGSEGFPNTIDWTHANAVVPIKNQESYLVNFRFLSAMIKVNKNMVKSNGSSVKIQAGEQI